MTIAEKTASDHQGISAPKTLAQLLVLLVRETIKAIPRQIPLIIGIFLLGTLLHTFLMAGPNGGYGRELTLLSDLLATQGRYGVEGTGNNTLIAPLLWAVLSALAFYTFYRIKSVGLGEYLAGFTRGIAWIFKSFSALAARAVPALSVGGAIALAIVGLTRNNAIGLVLCAPLIAALGEQLDSLWFTFLRLGWSDARRLTKRFAKSEKPFDPAVACVGTVGASLGFLVGYTLPGIRFSGAYAFVGALFLGAVAVAFTTLRKKGLPPPTALFLAFLLASMLVALPVFAHDKGVVEEGGWRNWLTQPGVLQAIAQGLSPAAVAALGLPTGATLSAVWNALQNIKPGDRVKIYNEVTGSKPELLYPESLLVPHDHKPPKPPPPPTRPGGAIQPGGALTLLQTIQSGTGGAPPPPQSAGTGTAPPAAPPLPTRTTVYSGKDARDMLQGLGIFTADQIKSLTAQSPDNLDTLLGNKKGDKPYQHAIHDYKDPTGNTTALEIRNIRDIKGIAFEETKDGQIDLNTIAIIVEENDTTSTLPVKPIPPSKPKPPIKPTKPAAKPPIKPAKPAAKPPIKPAKPAAKPPIKPTKPAAPPTITSVLQDRISTALKNPDGAGRSQLTLTMQDFKGMIPNKVDLPGGAGSVTGIKPSFDPQGGLMTIQAADCKVRAPDSARGFLGMVDPLLEKIASETTIGGKVRVSVRPSVENGRLTLKVEQARVGQLETGMATIAQKAADKGLAPINKMLSDHGATLQDVKVESDGIRLVLRPKPAK